MIPAPEFLKRWIRNADAALSPLRRSVQIEGRSVQLVRTVWWDESAADWIADEINPYFQALPSGFIPKHVIDAGGSTGMFALAAALRWPSAHITVFEPSIRQRIVLKRNARLAGVAARITLRPEALWNEDSLLSFRSNGSVSGIRGVSQALPLTLDFSERVTAVPLDDLMVDARGSLKVDLIKMDIEGAEVEALEGARRVLGEDRPVLLVQAYHLRAESRTLEPCRDFLEALGYQTREVAPPSGFLVAAFPDASLP